MICVGVEIGVVFIKVFIIQFVVFLMLILVLGKENGMLDIDINVIVLVFYSLLVKLEEILVIIGGIEDLVEEFVDKNYSLFLGCGD